MSRFADVHLRIARPVRSLERSTVMYRDGLQLEELGRFADHGGFDGVMLGRPGLPYHFELTHCRFHPVPPAPTPEDLMVFYLPVLAAWEEACTSMLRAGFAAVPPFNPYWRQRGRTFEDLDRYRIVLQNDSWTPNETQRRSG